MKRGKLVKDMVGSILFPIGFEMKFTEGWDFSRIVKNSFGEEIDQCIIIYLHRYTTEVFLSISANAYGRFPLMMKSFVPQSAMHPRTMYGDSITYSNDESFKEVICYMADIIEKYALDKLTEISEPATMDRFLEEEYINALENHQSISEEFMRQEGIPTDIDLEASARIVYEKMIPLRDKPFLEIKNSLFSLGVFYACQLEKVFEAEWRYINRSTFLCYKRGDAPESLPVLDRMKWCWMRKEVVGIKEQLDKLRTPVHHSWKR